MPTAPTALRPAKTYTPNETILKEFLAGALTDFQRIRGLIAGHATVLPQAALPNYQVLIVSLLNAIDDSIEGLERNTAVLDAARATAKPVLKHFTMFRDLLLQQLRTYRERLAAGAFRSAAAADNELISGVAQPFLTAVMKSLPALVENAWLPVALLSGFIDEAERRGLRAFVP